MNGRSGNGEDPGTGQRLYRDPENKLVLGVCAGIADYFGFDLTTTRVCVAVSLVFFMPATLMVYFGLVLLLPKRPHSSVDSIAAGSNVQRAVRSEPHGILSSVNHRYRELEVRLQRLEKYVTSPSFQLDQEFEALED
jgi:phage shock protein C